MADEDKQHNAEQPAAPVVLDYARPGSKRNQAALAAVILGSVSLIFVPLGSMGALAGGGWELMLLPGVTSLVCAIVFAGSGLHAAREMEGRGQRQARAGLTLGLASLGLAFLLCVLVLTLDHGDPHPRPRCASHLRQIGQGLMLYANDHQGLYPKRLEPLITDCDINPECFVCPSSNDDKARGPTTQAMLADFAKPGHCSYIYLGANLNSGSSADHVLAYEPLANHDGDGANFLFNDGSVQWINKTLASQAIKELEAGQNPPPSLVPVTMPSEGGRK